MVNENKIDGSNMPQERISGLYKQEATTVLNVIKREKCLDDVLGILIEELQCVSTFDFEFNGRYWNAEKASSYLKETVSSHSRLEGHEEMIYCLYLLSVSESRHEALNNQLFTLERMGQLFHEKLARFGYTADANEGLFGMAQKIKQMRDALAQDKCVYESIDGTTRVRNELIMDRISTPDFEAYAKKIDGRTQQLRTEEDYLALITELSEHIMELTNADYVLFSGPRYALKAGQDTTPENFFSYVYIKDSTKLPTETEYSNKIQLSNRISSLFRVGRKRYFDKGYHTLWPAIAINEDNRPPHNQIGLKSVIRCPGGLFGEQDMVDLRCASRTNNQFSLNKLNTLINYMDIYSKIVECAIINGILLPGRISEYLKSRDM